MFIRPLVTTGLAISLCACVAVPVTVQPRSSAIDTPAICVFIPTDPTDGTKSFPSHGMKIAEHIRQTLESAGRRVVLIAQSNTAAITSCTEDGARVQLRTTVVSYRDFATGWTGQPDQIELVLQLVNPGEVTPKQVAYAAKSNVLAAGVLEWGNAKPWELLGQDFDTVLLTLVAPK